MQLTSRARLPSKTRPLFERHRYKVLRGGRASAKSWAVARVLLQLAGNLDLRARSGFRPDAFSVLCGREHQSSIRESVHKLLRNQIEAMNLGSMFRIEQNAIYGPAGAMFVFIGLAEQSKENMKSYEDFDVCWVEEAQVLTQGTLNTLLPTIRRPGSEIWFTYNPELDDDPMQKFAESLLPADGVVIDLHYRDNPWFNATLEAERVRAQRTLPKVDYENIWEGKLRPTVAGAIYADEIADMVAQRRIGDYPYDPFHLVHPIFDLGWNDSMVLGLAQRHISQLRLIDYIEDDHKTLDWYSQELRKRPYSYGTMFLPHDGDHGDYRSDHGKSAKQILEGLGWRVEVLPRRDVEDGIRETRMALKQLFVDRTHCAPWHDHMKRYRRTVSNATKEAGPPLHDQHSHCADMTRYLTQAAPQMADDAGIKLAPLEYGRTGIV